MGILATVLTLGSGILLVLNVWLRARGAAGTGYRASVYTAATLAFVAMIFARVGWHYVGFAVLPFLLFCLGLWQVAALGALRDQRRS